MKLGVVSLGKQPLRGYVDKERRGEGEEKLLTPKQHESRLSTPEVDWSMIRGEGGEKLAVKAR